MTHPNPSLLRKEGQSHHPPLYEVERGNEGVSIFIVKDFSDGYYSFLIVI